MIIEESVMLGVEGQATTSENHEDDGTISPPRDKHGDRAEMGSPDVFIGIGG